MSNISRERIIETATNLSNKAGLENLSLKMIAEELKIKSLLSIIMFLALMI